MSWKDIISNPRYVAAKSYNAEGIALDGFNKITKATLAGLFIAECKESNKLATELASVKAELATLKKGKVVVEPKKVQPKKEETVVKSQATSKIKNTIWLLPKENAIEFRLSDRDGALLGQPIAILDNLITAKQIALHIVNNNVSDLHVFNVILNLADTHLAYSLRKKASARVKVYKHGDEYVVKSQSMFNNEKGEPVLTLAINHYNGK